MATQTTIALPLTVPPDQATSEGAGLEQHSLRQTLALHLAPGVLAVGVFLLAAPAVQAWGYPADFARALLALPIAVIGFQLGYLLYEGHRRSGRLTLAPVIGFRSPLPWRQYVLWIGLLFAWTILVYLPVASMLGDVVQNSMFGWLPSSLTLEADYTGYATSVIATIFVVQLVVLSAAAAVEELYFRGHLLPRLSRFGMWAPLISTVLFALCHLDTVWSVPSVLVAFLPIAYVVYWKRNIWIAVVLHVAVNAIWQVLIFAPLLTSGA